MVEVVVEEVVDKVEVEEEKVGMEVEVVEEEEEEEVVVVDKVEVEEEVKVEVEEMVFPKCTKHTYSNGHTLAIISGQVSLVRSSATC